MQFRNLIKSNIKNIDPELYTATQQYIEYQDKLNGNNKLQKQFQLLSDCMHNYGKDTKSVYRINYNLMDCHISTQNDTDINKVLDNTNILDNISDHIDAKTTYEYGIQQAVQQSEQFIRNIVSVYGDKGINIIKHPNGAVAFPDFDFTYNNETYHVEIKATLCKQSQEEGKLIGTFNNSINNKNAVLEDISNKDSLLRNTLCMNIYYYIDIENNAFVYVGVDVYPIVLAVKWKYDSVQRKLIDLMTRSAGENSTNNNALISAGQLRGLTSYNKFELFNAYINDNVLLSDNDLYTIETIETKIVKLIDLISQYNIIKNSYTIKSLKATYKKLCSLIKQAYKLINKLETLISTFNINNIKAQTINYIKDTKEYINNEVSNFNISLG